MMGIYYNIDRDDGYTLNLWKFGHIHRGLYDRYDQFVKWDTVDFYSWRDDDFVDQEVKDSCLELVRAAELFCAGRWVRFYDDATNEDSCLSRSLAMEKAFFAGWEPPQMGGAYLHFPIEVEAKIITPWVGKVDRIWFDGANGVDVYKAEFHIKNVAQEGKE